MTAAIETVGLTKHYGATRAVVDLDLEVRQGECFGFLGPNGAGKTTTIRMLLALHRPTRGRSAVVGLDSQTDSLAIHRRTGYLPGDLALYPRMTGRQHIDWFSGARRADTTVFAAELADRLGVVLDRPTRELSTGNRQKIGIVLAFMHRPELLVLDEPTSGLDPLKQDEFEQLVRETVAEGRTVFLSSHDLDEVQRLADRVGIIRSGNLLTTGTVESMRRSAPRRVEARFARAVDPRVFADIEGVSVTSSDGGHVTLELTGAIGPVLRVLADNDPLDVTSRPPDLDELFLSYYRDPPVPEPPDAR
jgi:ABC-2 type transport system ATP-binding protein